MRTVAFQYARTICTQESVFTANVAVPGMTPGSYAPFAFTTANSNAQQFRDPPATNVLGLPPVYVTLKTDQDVAIVFGFTAAGTANPAATPGFILQAADSWQDFILPSGIAFFKCRGITTTGVLRIGLATP